MEIFNETLSLVNSIPSEVWILLVETAVGAIVVSPIMVGIKKWFSIDGEKKMLFFVMLASMGAAVVAYLVTIPQFAPWIILAQGWLVFATTQPVYLYFVKPTFSRVGTWFANEITRATQINEAKAAQVPPEGLPLPASGMFDDTY